MLRTNLITKKNNSPFNKADVLPFDINGSTITKYKGSATSVNIPSSYSIRTHNLGPNRQSIEYIIGTDYPITTIGEGAFENNTSITSVTIPNTIRTIGKRAFQFCYNLKTVTTTANTITTIDYCAFAFTKINWQTLFTNQVSTLTTLGQGAFAVLYQSSNSTELGSSSILVLKDVNQANLLLSSNLGLPLSHEGYTARGAIYIGRLVGGRSYQTNSNNYSFTISTATMKYTIKEDSTTHTHSYIWMDGGSYKSSSSGGISYRGFLYGDSCAEYNGAPGGPYYFCTNTAVSAMSVTIGGFSGSGTITPRLNTSSGSATSTNISTLTAGEVKTFYCHFQIS